MTKTTLVNDFDGWWTMKKYRDREIEARNLYGELEVAERIADTTGKMWPGKETGVVYFVRLWGLEDQKIYVGFRHEKDSKTGRFSRYCEFPIFVEGQE